MTTTSNKVVVLLALALVVAACDGTGESSTTSGSTVPATTTSTTSSSTTTAASTTTTVEGRAELPLAEPGDPELRVLFSIPAGPDGVTYEGGFEDWQVTGPQALDVASDGSIWIADTNGRRLLHYADDGSLLADIDTDAVGVGGLIDVAATKDGVWGLEVVPMLNRHRIVLFNESGELVDEHELPPGLHLQDGLWGIASAPNGQLWIELEGGASVYTAFDETGAFSPQPADGYVVDGVTMGPAPQVESGMARFVIGEAKVEQPVRELGGFTYEGTIPGRVALLFSDVAQDETGILRVDLKVFYVDFDGNISATAGYPLDKVADSAYVAQDFISVSPNGRLIAMMPGPDSLDIVELSLFPTD